MVKKNDVNSMEKEWDCLEKLIKKFELSFPSFSTTTEEKVELFTRVHNLSMCKDDEHQEKLYARHRKVLEDYLTTVVMPGMQDKKDELMLREFVEQWKSVKELGRRLYYGFKSLDLSYVLRRRNIPGLEDVKRLTFRDLVYEQLNGKVKDAVISLIDEEREGEQIDRALLKEVLNVFLEMGEKHDEFCYYKQHFEQHMIEDTGSYYSGKASSWLLEDSISCPDYLKKAEECLEKEKDRVSHYMHESSEEGLIRRVQHELLVVNCSQLLENQQSGFRALIREEKFDHLSRMFKLYNEIPGRLELVAHLFKQHITDQGNALVEEAAARNQIVNDEEVQNCFEKIIELNDQHLEYVKACFKENTLFHRALKEAFEVFCNKAIAGAPSAELLAIFADNLIKKSDAEKLSHAKVEETLEKLVKLLAYFNDKDLFVEFYRKKLAKRLLFDKSCNQDADKFFITKLKEQCGGPFTSKLEGMLTDVILSRETHKNLQDWFDNNPSEKPNFDLSVSILTTGCWPSYNSSDLNLPSEMVKGVEAFTKFYATKTNSRKLRWIYSLGNCHINGRFQQKTIEIIVSTYQASALLLFNDADRLSFSEIKTQLNLSHGDIVRVLHSLSSAKYKILNKEPKTKSISETDSFEFNSKFSDKMRRIRIPLPPKPIDERKKISEVVNQDRRYLIDAALVRIMKSRKVLGHQQLVSECVEALSKTFKPDIKAIKQRIEDLITREFIERDSKNPNVINYLSQAC